MNILHAFSEKRGIAPTKNRIYGHFAIFIFFLTITIQAWSQANFVDPGRFVVLNPCKAYTSFRQNSGESDLEINKIYTAHGENKSTAASHVHIDVEGQRKWVSLECGEYVGDKPAFLNQTGNNEHSSGHVTECLPFFDEDANFVVVGVGGSVDITPLAPEVETFGTAVNTVCGSPGKKTSKTEFKQLLKDHPNVLSDLMAYTSGKVFANRTAHQDTDAYLDDLTEAWYAIHAFDHIFCGEPKSSNSIGGLHYHGRYQQLQASGEVCRMANFNKNEVVPGSIYTMGVRMKRADGGWAQFATKGYGLTLSAADILKIVTRAFSENPTSSNSSTGCILDVTDADTNFKTVFVRRAKGIRTFFPDATPDFNRNPSCSSSITLSVPQASNCDNASGNTQTLSAGRFRITVVSVDENGFNLRVNECE